MKKCVILALLFLELSFHLAESSWAEAPLTLEAFLDQIKNQTPGLKASLASREGGELRSQEGALSLAPTLFANLNYGSDAKLNPFSFFTWGNITSFTFSTGVSQTTTFGLQAKLHYDVTDQTMSNPLSGAGGPIVGFTIPTVYINASPVLELTQNLWSNGFGRSTRAIQEQSEASALASSFISSFQAKTTLMKAEMTYWRLALARQAIGVQQGALERAQKIYEWNRRRARLQLEDQSAVVQAEAQVQRGILDLTSAKNEERSASRAFNLARNIDSDQVAEAVVEMTPAMIDQIQTPARAVLRDDVKAAQQQSRASSAGAQISIEKDSPTLDLVASFALNGQPASGVSPYIPYTNLSDAFTSSFSFNRPTTAIGFRFSMPLDFGILSHSREGWKKEHIAANLTYDQKVIEQEQNWKDLNETFGEAKHHLDLSRKLEQIQETKLTMERDRLKRGRTTTYQVLLFEQDYLAAQMMRIRDQVNVLNLVAQMKQFGETL